MSKQKGFTLLELVIVVAIIGILASIALIPNLIRFRERAAASRARADFTQIAEALELAQAENCLRVGNLASGAKLCCENTAPDNCTDAADIPVYIDKVPSPQASYLTYTFSPAGYFAAGAAYTHTITGFKAGGTFTCTAGTCSCSTGTGCDR